MDRSKSVAAWTVPAVLCGWGLAAGGVAPASQATERAIGRLVAGYRAETGADVGVHVVRLADGKRLCRIRSDELFVPASNQKILTAAVALKRLGAKFAFRTKLAAAGKDLLVIGDGDPTTGDGRLAAERKETIYAVFDRWAKALKRSGLRRIDGNLVIRAGIFQPPRFHPDLPREQRRRWYAAPAAGVNFNDNCFDVGFTVHGGDVRPVVTPVSRFINIRSRVRPGSRHLWRCAFDKTGTQLTLTGTVRRATPEPLPVAAPNPPMLFGCVLADRLARGGVELTGKLVVSTDPGDLRRHEKLKVIAVETTPLEAALRRANKQSLNMAAECLFLRSAVERGSPATWQDAARVAAEVLRGHYGLPAGQFRIADGSGLSRGNRASPAALTRLLRSLAGEKSFVRSLAIAGVDGSLRRRLAGGTFRGRIVGKTGSLAGVSALSGYVLDRAGRPALAFSIVVNGRTRGKAHSARDLQRAICRTLIRAADADPPPPVRFTIPPARRRSPRPGP